MFLNCFLRCCVNPTTPLSPSSNYVLPVSARSPALSPKPTLPGFRSIATQFPSPSPTLPALATHAAALSHVGSLIAAFEAAVRQPHADTETYVDIEHHMKCIDDAVRDLLRDEEVARDAVYRAPGGTKERALQWGREARGFRLELAWRAREVLEKARREVRFKMEMRKEEEDEGEDERGSGGE